MYQNKGFTLIEVLLTLSIIIVFTFLTLPYAHIKTLSYHQDMILNQISSIICHAKSMSLTTHQQVDLTFTQKNISCQIQDRNIKYVLPEGCYFSHLKKIYFNKNGNINQANHIMIHLKNNQIKLVFHLGNGDFCFES